VSAGAGDFEGALGGLLAANVLEIHREMLRLAQQRLLIDGDRENAVSGVQKMHNVDQQLNWIDIHPADHRRLFGIQLGNHNAGNLASASLDGNRKCAANIANAAIER
jgi:hypothetical protein